MLNNLLMFAWIATRPANAFSLFYGLPLVGLGSLAVQTSITRGSRQVHRVSGSSTCQRALSLQRPPEEAWLGRFFVGAFVFHAVAVSLNDNRLLVMHRVLF